MRKESDNNFRLKKQFFRITALIFAGIFLGSYMGHAQNNEKNEIVIDNQEEGRIFQGIGAVSAGASSRLLYDYSEPERSQILDYLFKPNYGANIQVLKVEIGGDMNSTDGAEASHMRSSDKIDCNRGYEWWLMKEAKKRNPDIKLAGLAWGTPGWIGDNFWSANNIDYHLEWLRCAEKEHDLQIDYMGGWNERPHDEKRIDWFIEWDKALEEKFPHIELISDDRCCTNREDLWQVVDDMYENEQYMEAIDNVGVHFACGHRTEHKECYSPELAKKLDQPLWMSENSAQDHDLGGLTTTRALNRMYIDARITGYITWSPISAWYDNIELADTGLMLAQWPWSGYYKVDRNIWAFAHTAQFAKPGWKYINNASGYTLEGASYVTLQSPNSDDFSTIIEALDTGSVEVVSFDVKGNLRADSVHVFATNMRSLSKSDYFVDKGAKSIDNGKFSLTVRPGYVYSLTTTTGQKKGMDKSGSRMSEKMELPYKEDFESYDEGKLARFFSDINGAFETAPCGGGREGTCYRQVLKEEPINWVSGNVQPATVMGDSRWWGDYTVSSDVLLEQSGYVEIVGRISAIRRTTQVTGYHLRVHSSGDWELYHVDVRGINDGEKEVIASGSNVSFNVGEWHELGLRMEGEKIDVLINGEKVDSVNDSYFKTGQIGFFVSAWQNVQFDNVQITPNGDWPAFVPKNNMRVYATSDHVENSTGHGNFIAEHAIDGRVETFWHSEWEPERPLPQSVTIELGGFYDIRGLMYQPRIDNNKRGMITDYNIYISSNGEDFEKVGSGSWEIGTSTKFAPIGSEKEIPKARYIRLEAVEAEEGVVSAAEIDVMIAD